MTGDISASDYIHVRGHEHTIANVTCWFATLFINLPDILHLSIATSRFDISQRCTAACAIAGTDLI